MQGETVTRAKPTDWRSLTGTGSSCVTSLASSVLSESAAEREARRQREAQARHEAEVERIAAERAEANQKLEEELATQKAIDMLETERMAMEAKNFSTSVSRYNQVADDMLSLSVKSGESELSALKAQNEQELETQNASIDRMEHIRRQQQLQKEYEEKQAALTIQTTSPLGILNPAYAPASSGAAPVATHMNTQISNKGFVTDTSGAAVPVATSMNKNMEASDNIGPAGRGVGVATAMNLNMPSNLASGGAAASVASSLHLEVQSGELTVHSAETGHLGSMPSRPADGGAAARVGLGTYSESGRGAHSNYKKGAPPPVYSESEELFKPGKMQSDPSYWPTKADVDPGNTLPRCTSCFDPIVPDMAKGFCGRAVRKMVGRRSELFHLECYWKKAAPACAYCTKPLATTQGFSGVWGTYRGKNYHAECFQQYAGPRCASCFDVIFANPKKGLSGKWLAVDGGDGLLHMECYLAMLKRAGSGGPNCISVAKEGSSKTAETDQTGKSIAPPKLDSPEVAPQGAPPPYSEK